MGAYQVDKPPRLGAEKPSPFEHESITATRKETAHIPNFQILIATQAELVTIEMPI